jgi:hypothetical protein
MSVTVIAEITQKNSANFAIVSDTNVKGGFSIVADSTARDAIPTGVRKNQMWVCTASDGKVWSLGSDLTTWTEKTFGAAVTYGTSSGTACEGNDSRLTNTRVPTDATVTSAKMDPTFLAGIVQATSPYAGCSTIHDGTNWVKVGSPLAVHASNLDVTFTPHASSKVVLMVTAQAASTTKYVTVDHTNYVLNEGISVMFPVPSTGVAWGIKNLAGTVIYTGPTSGYSHNVDLLYDGVSFIIAGLRRVY